MTKLASGNLKLNTIANLVGRLWTMFLGVALIPLYIKYLGVEAYGLIGFFGALQGVFVIFDLGIGAALNREMARLSLDHRNIPEQRSVLRTLELVYWGVAVSVGSLIFLLAPFIAKKWVSPLTLSTFSVANSIRLMGIIVLFQFILVFYQGGLMGLQRQVLVNWILIVIATVRGVGSLLVLMFISTKVETYFLFQIIPVFLGSLYMGRCLWTSIPHQSRAIFSMKALRSTWKFAAGWAVNSVFLAIFAQTDKILLSKLLTLDYLGYYTLAQNIVSPLLTLSSSICASVFPKFTQHVEGNDLQEMKLLYHKSSQYLTLLLVPASLVLYHYAWDILFVWTHNKNIADNAYMLVKLLVFGTLCSGLIMIPNYVQLAHNFFRLTIGSLVFLGFLYVPLVIFMVNLFNTNGAAASWTIINFCFLFSVPLMHRYFLPGEFMSWLSRDLLLPTVVAAAFGLAIKSLLPDPSTIIPKIIIIFVAYGVMLLPTAYSLTQVRQALRFRRT